VTSALDGFDRSLEEASNSLGAGPIRTFFRVTFPQIRLAVFGGALFAFNVSFDEVVVTLFISGVRSKTAARQGLGRDHVRDHAHPARDLDADHPREYRAAHPALAVSAARVTWYDCGTDKEATHGDDHHPTANHPRLCGSLIDLGAALQAGPSRDAGRQFADVGLHGAVPSLRRGRPGLLGGGRRWRPPARPPQQLHLPDSRPRAPCHHRGGDTPPRAGASFPMPTPEEVELASLLVERLPAVDQVRFTNSGSEAVMMAMKAARGFTGRPKIAKFEGAYHGSYDYAEVSLGSTAENWGPLAEPASVAYSRGTRRPSSRTWSSCRSIAPSLRRG
jgi:hypothetical protein